MTVTEENERILKKTEEKLGRNAARPLPFLLRMVIGAFLFLLLTALLTAIAFRFLGKPLPGAEETPVSAAAPEVTVVLDPGHGGPDPGAVSRSGVEEKGLNLAIAGKIAAILRAEGVNVILTRETDEMLRSAEGRGSAKSQDLLARVEAARSAENAVFVGIHMNSLPLREVRGLQVFYSPNDARSRVLAGVLQEYARARLQPDNRREIKKAGGIYVLERLEIPAVLVECGFLSNEEDTALLSDGDYQARLALTLSGAILQFLGENGASAQKIEKK